MYSSLTDEETIRQLVPNQCFETLYSRYAKKVYRRCLSMTKDTAKAQDFYPRHSFENIQQTGRFSGAIKFFNLALLRCLQLLLRSATYSQAIYFAPIEEGLKQALPDFQHPKFEIVQPLNTSWLYELIYSTSPAAREGTALALLTSWRSTNCISNSFILTSWLGDGNQVDDEGQTTDGGIRVEFHP